MRRSSFKGVIILILIALCALIVPSTNINPDSVNEYEKAAYEKILAALPSPAPATPTPVATISPTYDVTLATAAAAITPEPVSALDMTSYDGGYAPDENGYSDTTYTTPDGTAVDAEYYSDPTIEATYFIQRFYDSDCNFVRIKIKHPSQLRTAISSEVRGSSTCVTSKMAEAKNAVVAISGEYYTKREGSVFVAKQSNIIKSTPSSSLHQLLIDTDGNFHITLDKASSVQMIAQYTDKIYQAFSFGPALVVDGQKLEFPDYYFDADSGNPRTAIGQIGPLDYLVCVVNGRTDNDVGVSTMQLAQVMYDMGCQNAYNLDGGGSSTLYWHGDVVNEMNKSGTERDISDCVYFASAYDK